MGAVEVVDGTAQSVIQHGEIKADIPVDALFPAQVRIDVLGCSPDSEPLALIVILAISGHSAQGFVAVKVLVAGDTEVGTEFQVIEPAGAALHEVFLGDAPSG